MYTEHEPVTDENGEVFTYLNYFLLNKQGIDAGKLAQLKQLHRAKRIIMLAMESTEDPEHLRDLADSITDVEFELQETWGFPQDIRFHMFWQLPKCTCPKMDNFDRYPSGQYVVNKTCPIHGLLN